MCVCSNGSKFVTDNSNNIRKRCLECAKAIQLSSRLFTNLLLASFFFLSVLLIARMGGESKSVMVVCFTSRARRGSWLLDFNVPSTA